MERSFAKIFKNLSKHLWIIKLKLFSNQYLAKFLNTSLNTYLHQIIIQK